jgi:PAS domain S-box-containing protein
MGNVKPLRILYMDDDQGLARLFQKNLEREGYVVDIAPDGKSGLAMYETGGYDIVAVDQAMPGMTGIEVLRLIARREDHPPMIMVTGTGSEEIAVESLKLGAADYIIKDVDGYYLKLIPSLVWKIVQKEQIMEERRQALNALLASEEKFSKVFHFNPNPMTIVRLKEGTYVDVNESVLRFTGYTRDEVIGRTPSELDFFSGEDMARLYRLLMEHGEVHDYEYTFRLKSGGEETGLISAIILDLAGERCVLTVTNVITGRKKAEYALKLSEQLKASILNTVPHAIMVLRNRVIMYASKGSEVVFGWGAHELMGGSTRILYRSDEEYEMIGRGLYPALELQKTDCRELVCRHRDGRDIICRLYTSVIGDRLEDKGVVALFEDVTEHRRMQEEVEKARHLESIGTLAGGIAHDFNNILTGIMGNISIARAGAAREERVISRLDKAEQGCVQAHELASRLVTFSRGGVPWRKTSSLGRLLREAVGSCICQDIYRTDLAIPDDLWDVEMDDIQMRQCVENLIINAKESMPGGGSIHISAENIPDASLLPDAMAGKGLRTGGPHVRWSVADRGCGILQEHLPKIFDPYFSTKPFGSAKGLGLGLSICHSIVTRHEGLITVASDAGKGTTVSVYLPCRGRLRKDLDQNFILE